MSTCGACISLKKKKSFSFPFFLQALQCRYSVTNPTTVNTCSVFLPYTKGTYNYQNAGSAVRRVSTCMIPTSAQADSRTSTEIRLMIDISNLSGVKTIFHLMQDTISTTPHLSNPLIISNGTALVQSAMQNSKIQNTRCHHNTPMSTNHSLITMEIFIRN